MKVFLLRDIPNLGYKHEIVDVKSGYAKHALIPQKLAKAVNQHTHKKIDEVVKQTLHKEKRARREAEEVLLLLKGLQLAIPAKATEKGKLFGSVTQAKIIETLQEKENIDLAPYQMEIQPPISALGKYNIPIRLYKEMRATLQVDVVRESSQ